MTKEKQQTYSNHTRFFPLHHFFIAPLSIVFLIGCITVAFNSNWTMLERALVIIMGVLIFILPMLARIYGLKNQDRLIRLEMRQRYFELSGKSFFPLENELSKGQIIALRFAGDDELIDLIEKAKKEKLTPKVIKQSVKNWRGDYWRV
jgi:hypothetical protein